MSRNRLFTERISTVTPEGADSPSEAGFALAEAKPVML
jgi:hypothetical protein